MLKMSLLVFVEICFPPWRARWIAVLKSLGTTTMVSSWVMADKSWGINLTNWELSKYGLFQWRKMWKMYFRRVFIQLKFDSSFPPPIWTLGIINASSLMLDINDFLIKTSLQEKSRTLVGPLCCSVTLEAKWCKHSGNPGPELSVPKIHVDVRGGLIQVCTWS